MTARDDLAERAAKAIYEAKFSYPTWEGLGGHKELYRRQGRAALDVIMPETTEAGEDA